MDRQGMLLLRCIVRLISTAHAAASALREDREPEYQRARRDFDATCAETDCLLGDSEDALAQARQLAPPPG